MAAVARAARAASKGHVLCHVLWHVLRNALRQVLRHVLIALVLHKGSVGGDMRVLGVGSAAGSLRVPRSMNNFTLPSSAALDKSCGTSCAASCAMSCAASITCPSFTCRPRADLVPPVPKRAEDLIFFISGTDPVTAVWQFGFV